MKATLLLALASLGMLTACGPVTTAAEVDAAFLLCSPFGGVKEFSTAGYMDKTTEVKAICRDGASASRRIKEQMRDFPLPVPMPKDKS